MQFSICFSEEEKNSFWNFVVKGFILLGEDDQNSLSPELAH